MSLVTAKEVAKVINLDKYGFIGTFFGWSLMNHELGKSYYRY